MCPCVRGEERDGENRTPSTPPSSLTSCAGRLHSGRNPWLRSFPNVTYHISSHSKASVSPTPLSGQAISADDDRPWQCPCSSMGTRCLRPKFMSQNLQTVIRMHENASSRPSSLQVRHCCCAVTPSLSAASFSFPQPILYTLHALCLLSTWLPRDRSQSMPIIWWKCAGIIAGIIALLSECDKGANSLRILRTYRATKGGRGWIVHTARNDIAMCTLLFVPCLLL